MLAQNIITIEFDQSDLRKRNAKLSFLLELSNLFSTSTQIPNVLKTALAKIRKHFSFDAGRIYILDKDKPVLRLAASVGVDPREFAELELANSFSGKAVLEKAFLAQHVSDLEDRRRAEFLTEHGFDVVVCAPFIVMDQVVGVINLAAKKRMGLDQADVDLLMAIGNYLGVYINYADINTQLRHKVKELEAKNETIKFFSYSISHDLKGPAIGVYGIVKLLYDKYYEMLDEKGRAYCLQILRSAENLNNLVEAINHYISAKESALQVQSLNVDEILNEIRSELAEVFKRRSIRLVTPDNVPPVNADKVALTRVFRNLIDNALKYGGDRMTEIRVAYRADNALHIFSVSDNGDAIEEEDNQKLFDPFQRSKAHHAIPGTGLGLAIVKEVAQSHGGKAWLESGPQSGATFFFSLSRDL